MQPYTRLTAVAAPLDIAKVDTGMIIAVRFTRIRRRPGHDYARAFLHDLRFNEQGNARPDFILNQRAYQGARILVTGTDFGCGSSREGAAYAVLDYGIRALIGPNFGDIFYVNCLQNGVLPVVLPLQAVETLTRQLLDEPGARITVDLEQLLVTGPDGARYPFDMDATRRQRLLHGLDDVGVTLQYLPEIEAFEARYRAAKSWLTNIV